MAYAETKPQVEIRYHTVADGHVDDFPLTLLADLLNGRTGRLYKSLVLDQQVANEASADQEGRNYEGYFELKGVAKPGKTPEEVEKAIHAEMEKLIKEPVSGHELQKVKNQRAAGEFRKLRSNFSLMIQLLMRDAGRGWATINADPKRIQAVTAEDIQRVAKTYFTPENRTAVVYYTKPSVPSDSSAASDPALASLSEEEKGQVRQFRARVEKADKDQVKKMLQDLGARAAAVPEDKKKFFEVLQRILEEQLKKEVGK